MGDLLTINVKMHQPIGAPFECPDKYNGEHRGTWWYRGRKGELHGPFWTRSTAEDEMAVNEVVEPFQDAHRFWWFRNHKGGVEGPFQFISECDAAIVEYINRTDK